mmetsp:Transcript_5620/g.11238  ORF Transcript_5620/g.11238 Transcript_5620/m.11238 type:complete len:227 (-) Transcript_5620:1130-1810(-)
MLDFGVPVLLSFSKMLLSTSPSPCVPPTSPLCKATTSLSSRSTSLRSFSFSFSRVLVPLRSLSTSVSFSFEALWTPIKSPSTFLSLFTKTLSTPSSTSSSPPPLKFTCFKILNSFLIFPTSSLLGNALSSPLIDSNSLLTSFTLLLARLSSCFSIVAISSSFSSFLFPSFLTCSKVPFASAISFIRAVLSFSKLEFKIVSAISVVSAVFTSASTLSLSSSLSFPTM